MLGSGALGSGMSGMLAFSAGLLCARCIPKGGLRSPLAVWLLSLACGLLDLREKRPMLAESAAFRRTTDYGCAQTGRGSDQISSLTPAIAGWVLRWLAFTGGLLASAWFAWSLQAWQAEDVVTLVNGRANKQASSRENVNGNRPSRQERKVGRARTRPRRKFQVPRPRKANG